MQTRGASRVGQLTQESGPGGLRRCLDIGQKTQRKQRIVHLVRRIGLGPGFGTNAVDGSRVEAAQALRGRIVEPAPRDDGLRTALLQRRVVQIRIRSRGQDFERERGRHRQVARYDLDRARFDLAQHALEALDVHRFVKAIVDGLIDQRMIGNFARTDEIFRACDLVGKHGRHEIFRPHALQRRRHLLASAEAREREGYARDPTPACSEHRRVQHCLDQHLPDRRGTQVARHRGELEAM